MKTPVIIGGKSIGRWRASFLLFKESWRFLRADKELLLVPIGAFFFQVLLVGLVTILFITLVGPLDQVFTGESRVGYVEYAFFFVVYVCGAFALALAQAIIVHIVYVRAHGGNATLGAGIARAFSHWLPLFIWALITSTVGMILRTISERSQIVGRIVAGLLGAVWAVLTFFAIPVILIEHKSPFQAISASAQLFKKTWGETLISNVTLGAVFVVAHLLVLSSFIGLIIFGASTQNSVLLVVAIFGVILWLIIATVINAALQGILKTLLYIYAAENVVPANFNRELLESMLVKKGVGASAVFVTGVPPTNTLV